MANERGILLKVFHGGTFVWDGNLRYEGGSVDDLLLTDRDGMDLKKFKDFIVGKLKYNSIEAMFYLVPRRDLEAGIRKLETHLSLLSMFIDARWNDFEICIYCCHGLDDPIAVDDDDAQQDDPNVQQEENQPDCHEVDPSQCVTQENQQAGNTLEDDFFLNEEVFKEFYAEYSDQIPMRQAAESSKHYGERENVSVREAESSSDEESEEEETESELGETESQVETWDYSGSSEDEPYVQDMNDGDSSDCMLSDNDVENESDDEVKEARRNKLARSRNKGKVNVEPPLSTQTEGPSTQTEGQPQAQAGESSSHQNTYSPVDMDDELREEMAKEMYDSATDSYPDTDSENEDEDGVKSKAQKERKRRFVIFNPNTDMNHVRLFVGLSFPNAKVLRAAVRKFGLDHQIDMKFVYNESQRINVVCNNSKACPWRIWARKQKNESTMSITVMNSKHECGKATKVRQLSSRFIAKTYLSRILANPKWRVCDMSKEIDAKYEVSVPLGICSRAKKRALIEAVGTMQEHYGKLWNYRKELKKTNPGSTIDIDYIDSPRRGPVFQRLYICFKALKDGFKAGCMRFIGLDGCFLKGFMKGQLLVAVGRDGNNQMFPVAWAVVQVENKDNWSWFLGHLKEDLDMGLGLGWILMSDKMKGIIYSVKELLPYAEHRNCARHVYANWSKDFKGVEYKWLFWDIAKASNDNDYKEACKKLKEVDEKALGDLLNRDVEQWCRAFFTETVKCENCENNMVEGFSGSILESRDKHLLYLLKDLRKKTMIRMQKRRDWMSSHWDVLCPRIRKRIDDMGREVRLWGATFNGVDKYEVDKDKDSHVVCLPKKDCTCREWNLSGIPCVHALCCIYRLGHKAEDYVDECYFRDTFVRVYGHALSPITGENNWAISSKIPLLPPRFKKMPGRIQTKRRREPQEPKQKKRKSDLDSLGRRGIQMHCRTCGGEGHNSRTCPQKKAEAGQGGQVKTGKQPCSGAGQSKNGKQHCSGGDTASGGASKSQGGQRREYKKERNLGVKKVSNEGIRNKRGRPPKQRSHFQMKSFGVYHSPSGDTYYRSAGSKETVHVEQVMRRIQEGPSGSAGNGGNERTGSTGNGGNQQSGSTRIGGQ